MKFENSKGEDALNLVNGQLDSKGEFIFTFIDQDAFDSDSSEVRFNQIYCINVGNDCLDTSYSKVKGKIVSGQNIGDKLVSIGENSSAYFDNIRCSNCGIGVAVKDSSNTEIDYISFSKTPLYFSIFQKKKKFFGPGEVMLRNSDISYSNILSKSLIGRVLFLNITTLFLLVI